MDWKTWEDFNTTHSNLQIQYNTYENPNNVISRNRKFHPKIHMESQEILQTKIILKTKARLELSHF